MNIISKVSLSAIMVVALSFQTGCLSYMSYKASEKELVGKRIHNIEDAETREAAIKAFQSGDIKGIGIDISNLEALGTHPFRQTGAAIGDLLLIWGLAEGADSINGGGGSGRTGGVSISVGDNSEGNFGDINNINGQGNTINNNANNKTEVAE
jgi:hypothetical protein